MKSMALTTSIYELAGHPNPSILLTGKIYDYKDKIYLKLR